MAKISYHIETRVPPEAVLRAATDFSPRRLELWSGIDPAAYRVHGAGEGWAEVTEGTRIVGGIWARERYEWSGNRVEAIVQDSNVFRPGGRWQLTVEPNGDGGSSVRVAVHRRAKGLKGRAIGTIVQLMGGRVLPQSFARTLAALEQEAR